MLILPKLRIGPFETPLPIIQGGMGVRVSGSGLASAVADNGCIGVISSAGLGYFGGNGNLADSRRAGLDVLRSEIQRAKSLTDGIIAVNIMCVLSDYADIVRATVDAGAHMIISGAGLPLDLPALVCKKDVALVPIVSSRRAMQIICRKWQKRFSRLPDAVVVEGPLAGGHLGYGYEELTNGGAPPLEDVIPEIVAYANSLSPSVPVIAAGGVFDGSDVVRCLQLGAAGVQMATRFVCTDECDVHDNFKLAYVNAKSEDLVIIKSPVGLPGRVIRNKFVDKILSGRREEFTCNYRCLKTCDPAASQYCIARVLTDAAKGMMDESFCFAGTNVCRCKEILGVKTLIEQIVEESHAAIPAVP